MKYLTILISVILFLWSCDKSETPYYTKAGCTDALAFNYDPNAIIEDSCCYIAGCVNTFAINYNSEACHDDGSCILINPPIFDTIQKILIEDFTGHKCMYCPDAADILEGIISTHPNQVVGMAIHGDYNFSKPNPMGAENFTYDFRTIWGKGIDDFFGASALGLPKGMINRIDYAGGGSHLKERGSWETYVGNILGDIPKFGINIQIVENKIVVSAKVFTPITNHYNIVVCLTEDNIIEWQKVLNVNDEFYKHKHVLRSVLTSSWSGEALKSDPSYEEDEIISKVYNFNLADLEQDNINTSSTLDDGNGNAGGWIEDNMNVVAYIYNTSNWQIEQVEEVPLAP